KAEKIRKARRGFMTIHRAMRTSVSTSPMATIDAVFVIRLVPRFVRLASPTTDPQLASPGPREKMTNQYGRMAAQMAAFRMRDSPPTKPRYGCRRRDAETYTPPARGISMAVIVAAAAAAMRAKD